MNQKISRVFFDFDGVLTLNALGSTVTIRTIQDANSDVNATKIEHCYYRFHQRMLLGEINHYDIWDDYCKCIGKDISSDVLTEAFLATPINTKMMNLAFELSRNYRLGIVTANAIERLAALIYKYGLDKLFDPIVISAEIGGLKTKALIFESALGGESPNECVFIDNQENNLSVPAKLGFKTYLFDPKENDISELIGQLVKWGIKL